MGLLLGLWFLFGHIIKKHSGNQSGKSVKKHQIPDIASAFKPKSKNEQRKQPRALPSWAAAMKSKRKSKQRPIIQTSELRPDLLNREDVLITDRSNIDFEIAALRRISQHQQVTSNRTDRSNSYISDRELSDFRITINTTSTYARGSSSKNKKPAKWIHPGQTVKIANIDIKGGYFYLGGQLPTLDNYGTEASLIDPTLRVDNSSPDYRGDQMGYWPYYSDISPRSRAAYLQWLASNRDDPTCYIGYVFLYFYGIERRLLIDGKHMPSSEREALVNEVRRLIRIYGGSRSFKGYATSLLAHVWVLYSQDTQPDGSLLTGTRTFTSVFKYLLGRAVADGIPVSGKLALAWVRSHPDYSLRLLPRRCPRSSTCCLKLYIRKNMDREL